MDDPYRLLQVAPDASPEKIRNAFRRTAKTVHPDLYQGSSEEEHRRRQLQFVRLTQAYEVLSDPQRREAFDQSRRKQTNRASHHQKTWTSTSASARDHSWQHPPRTPPEPEPEQALEELLNELQELLGRFDLRFRDPLDLLMDWAKRVFRDAVQAWDAAGQEEHSPTPNSQSTQDWKSEIEAELNRLRKQAAGASPRASTTASSYRPRTTDAEIEVELSRLKERFR